MALVERSHRGGSPSARKEGAGALSGSHLIKDLSTRAPHPRGFEAKSAAKLSLAGKTSSSSAQLVNERLAVTANYRQEVRGLRVSAGLLLLFDSRLVKVRPHWSDRELFEASSTVGTPSPFPARVYARTLITVRAREEREGAAAELQ
eukprot:6187478-Pleurochrysis_carterae.AAC.2